MTGVELLTEIRGIGVTDSTLGAGPAEGQASSSRATARTTSDTRRDTFLSG